MRIEIFVVETVNPTEKEFLLLEGAKGILISAFGGLTEVPFVGYCKDHKGNVEIDTGKIWLIYTDLNERHFKRGLKHAVKQIKTATKQISQMYAIDNKAYFI